MSRFGVSARDSQIVNNFKEIKQTLLDERYQDRLSKPLAYWALPNDRRLPLAFLNKPIGELVNTPFEELAATPGIGQKKISSLLKLLQRATRDEPPTVPFGLNEPGEDRTLQLRVDQGTEFNAFLVSEALWSEWTKVVIDRGLGNERLGRVAESLKAMPTVIWSKRLGDYENLTLAQIRSLRTHGEKRVRCVLEVFHRVHEIAKAREDVGDASLRRQLGSQRVWQAGQWLKRQIERPDFPSHDEVLEHLANPILEQIEVDCGTTVHGIAKQRLGIDGEPMSVREQAQTMGVTRARIYQLIDDCHKVLDVRWPDGKLALDQLTGKLAESADPDEGELFLAVRQLCFPDRNQPDTRSHFEHTNHLTTN